MSKPLDLHAPVDAVARKPGVGVVIATGTSAPSDGAAGYAKGCLFIDTDASAGAQLLVNEGTSSSADFNPATGVALSGLTATAAELNQAADSSANVEAVTTTNVIAAAESGATFFLNSATGFVSTLPAAAAGLRFFFVVGATPPTSGDHTVVTASGKIIQGGATVAGADVPAADESTISFVASTAIEGDQVYVISDGTNWYVNGRGTASGSITFTAP